MVILVFPLLKRGNIHVTQQSAAFMSSKSRSPLSGVKVEKTLDETLTVKIVYFILMMILVLEDVPIQGATATEYNENDDGDTAQESIHGVKHGASGHGRTCLII
jgi:hypothetical protein